MTPIAHTHDFDAATPPNTVKPNSTHWPAHLTLGFRSRSDKTVLAQREREGPLSVQRPFYPEGDVCHVYLLHPPGGVAGGDQLRINTHLSAKTHALITTPGATKFYRCDEKQSSQRQVQKLDNHATLEWLPQENIFFPGARATLSCQLDLQENSRVIAWEINCFGRPSLQETWHSGEVSCEWKISYQGAPLLIEKLRVDAQCFSQSSHLRAQSVSAQMVIFPADKAQLAALQSHQFSSQHGDNLSLTLIDQLLIVRYLGGSTERARAHFHQIWQQCRPTVLGKAPCSPRIWNT